MTEWKECTIADIGTVVGGATPSTKDSSNYDGGEIAWITPKDLSNYDDRYISHGERNITEKGLNGCSAQLMPKHSVLFTSRAPIGYVAIADGEVCTNQGFKSVVPNENTDYLFLYYLLRYNKDKIEGLGSGTTFKEVSGSTMKGIKVRVPTTLSAQKAIGRFLDSIDCKIEQNRKINKNLLQQAEAIYKAWFCDRSVENGSTHWPNTTIGDITSLVVRGITPKYNDDADQIVINQKCIRNHMVDLTLARRHFPKVITEKWLMQGDLLINSTGEGTLGRTAQVWFVPNNLTVDSHVTIVRPRSVALRNYIGLWGLTHEAEIESLHTGSTGQTELPRERVKAMELPLPDESTLSRFNELITPMTQAIVKNQHENIRLGELRDALLPRLMSGELDASDIDL